MTPKTGITMTSPLTIIHFLNKIRFERGGIVRSLMDMAPALASAGHEIIILTFDATDAPQAWRHGGSGVPRIVEIPAPSVAGGWLSRQTLSVVDGILRRADLLHLHAAWGLVNVQLANRARRSDVPYVVSPHGSLAAWAMRYKGLKKRIFLSLLGQRYLQNASVVLFTARRDLEEARTWIPKARLAILPLIFDFANFATLPGPSLAEDHFELGTRNGPRILYLSRIHPVKGLALLVEAISLLRDQGFPCQLIVAGPNDVPAYSKQVKTMIETYQIEEQVRFPGLVQGDMKLSLYEAADIFVLPTQMENFGLVQVEAMACGTPVITTKGVAIWKELQQGGAGIVDRTAPAMAQAIREWLADPESMKRRGERSRNWVQQYLQKDQLVEQYEE